MEIYELIVMLQYVSHNETLYDELSYYSDESGWLYGTPKLGDGIYAPS